VHVNLPVFSAERADDRALHAIGVPNM